MFGKEDHSLDEGSLFVHHIVGIYSIYVDAMEKCGGDGGKTCVDSFSSSFGGPTIQTRNKYSNTVTNGCSVGRPVALTNREMRALSISNIILAAM